ncbi:DUF6640 family protein [Deinococcus sp.]|uniref:DUF6640 family protein n=1 Tax=Deinococcus sp. TaxID=47478 RepID=UPI003C7D210C
MVWSHALLVLVVLLIGVGGLLADFVVPATARQHLLNPHWPPHAKFHNAQSVAFGLLNGALIVYLMVFSHADERVIFPIAVVLALFYPLSMLAARLFPGTAWHDPEFDEGHPQIAGLDPNLAVGLFGLGLTVLAVVLHLLKR